MQFNYTTNELSPDQHHTHILSHIKNKPVHMTSTLLVVTKIKSNSISQYEKKRSACEKTQTGVKLRMTPVCMAHSMTVHKLCPC